MLSARLKEISNLIEETEIVLDIACDHAYLAIDLALKGHVVYASDISKEAIKKAKKNIASYNLKNRINLKIAPDLQFLNDEITTVVIAGLGGKKIIDILETKMETLENIKLILLAHNHHYSLRKFLMDSSFKITREKIVQDKQRYYFIIEAQSGKESYDDLELEFGPIILKEKTEVFKKYLKEYLQKKERYLLKLSFEEQEKLNSKIKRLKEI